MSFVRNETVVLVERKDILKERMRRKMNTLKTGIVVVAVLFSFICLFSSAAIAENTVAGAEEITGKEIQNKRTGKQTGVKKKRCNAVIYPTRSGIT